MPRKKATVKTVERRPDKRQKGTRLRASSAGPITVTANELRRLAEMADGMREENLRIAINSGEGPKLILDPQGWNQVVVRTEPTTTKDSKGKVKKGLKGMGHASEVHVFWESQYKALVRDLQGDAAFWTQAAVEKFVLPYYTRFYSDAEMERLRTASRRSDVVALVHRKPTEYADVGSKSPSGVVANRPRPGLVILRLVDGVLTAERFREDGE